jgi:hypothetical protein
MNIEALISQVVESIDSVLGEGYARKNPELIGRAMQSASIVEAGNAIFHGLTSLQSDEVFMD